MLRELNQFLKFSAILVCANAELVFLNHCLDYSIYPTWFSKSLRRNRINLSDITLRRLTLSKRDTLCANIEELEVNKDRLSCALDALSTVERDHFVKYVDVIVEKQ